MVYVAVFLLWTLCLYIIHVFAHKVSFLKRLHSDHHAYIRKEKTTHWHWNNLFLFNDTWRSTCDLWITEVIPTLVLSFITGHWWLLIFYYMWAAFFQENLEHNSRNNWYPFTAGQWHLIHHTQPRKNFGLFIPLWDKIFRTELKC